MRRRGEENGGGRRIMRRGEGQKNSEKEGRENSEKEGGRRIVRGAEE